ncbi:MAG TPA: DUF4215 domain-containing protein [Kofleriaceae bacterium]|jgi:cysteine-rich repeat protein
MRWALAWFFVLAACVKPDLVPCGDNDCPSGTVCHDGQQCVTTEQLTACDQHAEGDPCTAETAAGTCSDGVCVSARCGNSIVEVGEVCDDGNRISGDGCREDCLSDESCGNGLLDRGESCDCGSSAESKPAFCTSVNDDVLTAECDTTCTRRCGDGVVTGSEQCDGAVVPLGCGDFGYYAGEASCTPACTLDRSGCSGTCGDGIVQAAYGEQCDGAPPISQSCISYGLDAGQVACNALCAPDLANSCEQFDWEVLFTAGENNTVVDASANGHGVIGVREDGSATGYWDGVTFVHGNSYKLAFAADAFIGAASPTTLSRFDGTTWTDVALTAAPIAIEATRAGTVYVLHSDCTIEQLTSAWSSLPAPGTQCIAMKVYGDNEIYVSAKGAHLWKWDGHAWTDPGYTRSDDVYGIAKRGDTLVTASGLPYELGATQPLIGRSVYGMATSGSVVVLAPEDFPAIVPQQQWMHLRYVDDEDTFGRINSVRNTPDGQVIGWADGVFRLHTTWAELGTPDAKHVSFSPDGRVFTCGASDAYDATTFTPYAEGVGDCTSVLASRTQVVLTTSSYIYHWEGAYYGDQGLEVAAVGGFVDPSTDLIYILTHDDVVVRHDDGSHDELNAPAGCTWQMISAVDASQINIAGDCGGTQRFYRWQGGAWSELAMPAPNALDSMYVAPDGQIFGTYGDNPFDGLAFHWTGSSWETWSWYGTRVAGLSAKAVYFANGQNDFGVQVLHKWNGFAIEGVRLADGAIGQVDISASAGQIAVLRNGRVDVLIPIK